MIQVYNISNLFQEFHQISQNKVCHLQLKTRYVNNLSFQIFLSVKDMNAKKDFLNSHISSKLPLSEPNKKCVFNSMPILQSHQQVNVFNISSQ